VIRWREAIHATALNLPGTLYFILDPEGVCLETSEQTAARLGHPSLEIVGARLSGLFAPDAAERLKTLFDLAVRTRKPWEDELEQDSFWYHFLLTPILDPANGVHCVTLLGFDLTRQRRAEEQLHLSENRLRQIIDLVPHFIFAKDEAGRFILANRATAEVYGTTVDNLLHRTDTDFDHSKDEVRHFREDDLQVIRSGHPKHVPEECITDSLGRQRFLTTVKIPFTFSGTASPAVLGVSVDITEQKKAELGRLHAERQMLKAQKLESLGVLAGGIAHDFNNLLTVILGHAELAQMGLPSKDPVCDDLREIEKASRRAADLCSQLLTYAGGDGNLTEDRLDLNLLIQDMVDLLKTSITKKCVLRMNLHPDLPGVKGDAGQVRQIIMNLVINASEALGDRGGSITLSTGGSGSAPGRPSPDEGVAEPAENRTVWIEVADTGCGMDEETQRKVFDPFYSTKFTGRGLGLSTVAGIVRKHGGTIDLSSEPGKGTTFRIRFPALSANADPLLPDAETDQDWRGSGTVLLVDDEEGIRKLGKQLLERLGFGVLTAQDGQEAVEVYRRNRDRIRFVLMDLTMPRMDGEETFDALRAMNPDVRVVLTSGYSETDLLSRFTERGVSAFVHKPYSFRDLRTCAMICMASAPGNDPPPPLPAENPSGPSGAPEQ
jgi:PAS domain S-box-containing protein